MGLNNIVHCDECLHLDRQLNACMEKSFEKIDNTSCCRSCEKYSPSHKKLFGDFLEKIGLFKLIDLLASKLNKLIDFFTKRR